MKWLKKLLRIKCADGHDWELEKGTVSNVQLRDYEMVVGSCWSLSTHYERTKDGIVVYGFTCRKCGATKPATVADVPVNEYIEVTP